MRKFSIDWRLAGGFSALLFLIGALGVIGIMQIQALSKRIDELGKRYFPLQKASLEMRINNSLYAMGIRNYVFWKSSRYLDAARSSNDLGSIEQAAADFDNQLVSYSSRATHPQQAQWVAQITDSEKELRLIGAKIIELADQAAKIETINNLLMTFESRLYRIDDFIDNTLQDFNLRAINEQLNAANLRKQRAILLLQGSLVLAVLIGGQTAFVVYRNRRRERQRREELVQRMIRIEEEQRQNLSFQVHNEMGQDLSALNIYLDLIKNKMPPNNEPASGYINQAKKILSGIIDKGHNIVELLRPPALEEVGLVDTISGLIVQYEQISRINFTYQRPSDNLQLFAELSLILYRVAQEGLTNIIKHAQAKNVRVILQKEQDRVYLEIVDDGIGFDYHGYQFRPRRRKEDRLKFGLMGLREKIELLGGKMKVSTAPGSGTSLKVELPLRPSSS